MTYRFQPIGRFGVLLLICALHSAHSLGAPATSDEIRSQAEPVVEKQFNPAPGSGAPAVPGLSQSKSVELLLQLQDQPNAMGADSPKGGADAARRMSDPLAKKQSGAPADDPNPLAILKTTIMGDASARPADTESRDANPDVMQSRGGYESQRRSEGAPRESGSGFLANPAIRFIRENRWLTISVSLAVLAALWVTATFSLRRGR